MFCPIFPDNPSLHKTCNQLSGYSKGTRRLSSVAVTSADWAGHTGRKTLPYFSVPELHRTSKWCEGRNQKCTKVVVLSSYCQPEISNTWILKLLFKSRACAHKQALQQTIRCSLRESVRLKFKHKKTLCMLMVYSHLLLTSRLIFSRQLVQTGRLVHTADTW